jgi:hypothetical protein
MERSIISEPPKQIIVRGHLKSPFQGLSRCILNGRPNVCGENCPIEISEIRLENCSEDEVNELFRIAS